MICASEVGTIRIDPATVISKGRLQPGKMLLIDTHKGCLIDDKELKAATCSKHPFANWINDNMLHIDQIRQYFVEKNQFIRPTIDESPIQLDKRMFCFGFNAEQLNMIALPMVFFYSSFAFLTS